MLAELQNRRTLLLAKYRPDDRLVEEAEKEITDTQAALQQATRLTGVDQATDVNPVHQALEVELAKQQTELAGARRPPRDTGWPVRHLSTADDEAHQRHGGL